MPFREYAECPSCPHVEPSPAPGEYPKSWVKISDGNDKDIAYCSYGCARRDLFQEPGEIPLGLTDSDIRLLQALALGLPNKDIAAGQRLATSTVKNRLSLIFAKLGVTDRHEGVLMAHAIGVIDLTDMSRKFYDQMRERRKKNPKIGKLYRKRFAA